jgi:hypothetical protein
MDVGFRTERGIFCAAERRLAFEGRSYVQWRFMYKVLEYDGEVRGRTLTVAFVWRQGKNKVIVSTQPCCDRDSNVVHRSVITDTLLSVYSSYCDKSLH